MGTVGHLYAPQGATTSATGAAIKRGIPCL